jgi:DNA-binding transcriptional ArsR family regulator
MRALPDLAAVAALIADPSRAAMLSALMDGRSLPAGELARYAKISPQTASTHLAKLVKGGLLKVTATGRHRYFYLSNSEVAHTLESLALLAPLPPVRSLNDGLETQAIRQARTCYDHLAGRLGIAVSQSLIKKGLLVLHPEAYEVTEHGEDWFRTFNIDCPQLHKKQRIFAGVCLDWSERQPHLSGALGAAIAQRFFEMKWIARVRDSRAVKVTEVGRAQLYQALGVEWR